MNAWYVILILVVLFAIFLVLSSRGTKRYILFGADNPDKPIRVFRKGGDTWNLTWDSIVFRLDEDMVNENGDVIVKRGARIRVSRHWLMKMIELP